MLYYLKKNWKYSSLVCFLQICVWGMQAAVQLLLIQTFDAAIDLDFKKFMFWTIASLVCWGIYFALGIIQGYFQAQAIRKLNNHVRHDLYLSLMGKDYQEYNSLDSGEYISWLTNNIKQIEKFAWNPFFNGVGRVAQVLWCMLALALIDWTLLAAALVTALIMWSAPKMFEKKMEKMGLENSDAQAMAVGRLKDLLSGFYVLRLFGKQSLLLQRGDAASDQIESTNSRLNYIKNTVGGVLGFLSVTLQILSNILIVLLAFAGRVNIAVLAGGTNLISGVTNGFSNIANFRLSIAASKPYFMKINVQDDSTIQKNIDDLKLVEGSIKLENVSFYYGTKAVLKNISIGFQKGGKYALVGPSGCGKTTVLKLLLGWLTDYSGTIRFDEVNAKDYTINQLQRQISYIEQDVFLFNTTIKENITLGEQFSEDKLEKVIKDSALVGDLKNMPEGLETSVGEGGKCLSGGQKQRVAIARALIHNCSILLVDEGTSALDQENADIVEQSLLRNPELTLVLVSHHLSLERRNQFDKVYELKDCQNSIHESI